MYIRLLQKSFIGELKCAYFNPRSAFVHK